MVSYCCEGTVNGCRLFVQVQRDALTQPAALTIITKSVLKAEKSSVLLLQYQLIFIYLLYYLFVAYQMIKKSLTRAGSTTQHYMSKSIKIANFDF